MYAVYIGLVVHSWWASHQKDWSSSFALNQAFMGINQALTTTNMFEHLETITQLRVVSKFGTPTKFNGLSLSFAKGYPASTKLPIQSSSFQNCPVHRLWQSRICNMSYVTTPFTIFILCTIWSNHQQGCQTQSLLSWFGWAAPLIEIRRFHHRPRTLLRPRDQGNLSRDHLRPGKFWVDNGDLGEISWDILGFIWDVIIKNWDLWGFNEDITRNLSLKWQNNQLS